MENMNSKIILALAIIVVISFFLPWVSVESQEMGAISKMLTGKRQASIASISGFQVPVMANSTDARLAISVIKIFLPDVTDADKKALLVWVFPLLAAAIFLSNYFLGKNKWAHLAFCIVGILVFLVGAMKIMTTDMNKLVLNVKIGMGLWLTLLGFLGMGIIEGMNFIKTQAAK